ncbi:MAG: S8 family serine peptidase, partial [Candidatus Cryptobacteroides sp.]
MRKLLFPVLALLVWGCAKDVPPAEIVESQEKTDEAKESSLLEGEANIYLSEEMADLVEADLGRGMLVTKSSGLNSVLESLGASSMTRLFPYAGEFEPRTRKEGLHRWYTVKFNKDVPVTKACDDFTGLPGIELVEPVRRVRPQAVFNDPQLSRQWHYYNDGTLNSSFKAGADINVVPVWENYTVGNPDVIVAIVDGGIDYTHEDLAANYCGGYNFVRNTSVVTPHNHGTHVAGTVAAVNNNGKGVCGIAGGDAASGKKGVKLLSCQIFEPNPVNPDKDISGGMSSAIKWGADNGAVISQNSWGYVFDTAEEQAAATIDTPLKNAIDYFIKYAGIDASGNQTGPMRGGVVFFAAGNSTREHDPIGKYDPVISVGSIGPDYTRADYSNYGDWVDIAAPGGSVKYPSGTVLSTVPGNGYEGYQGTSMACPHVSGVAALVVSHFGGPGFTNQMLKDKILKGARTDALSMNSRIGPLLDAMGAMAYGGTKPPVAVTSYTAEPYSNNIRFSWKVTSDPDDKKAFGFVLAASKDEDAIRNLDLRNIPANVVTRVVMTEDLKVGDEISADLTALEFEKDYFVAVVAFDYNRNYSALSPVKAVRTLANNKPVIETDYDGDFKVKA